MELIHGDAEACGICNYFITDDEDGFCSCNETNCDTADQYLVETIHEMIHAGKQNVEIVEFIAKAMAR